MSAGCRWAVVPAAGSGSRFGQSLPKQYTVVHGKSVIEHSIMALLNACPTINIYVAIADTDQYWPQQSIAHHPQVHRVSGGVSRAASVQAGLESVALKANANDLVLVHDAARPCVASEDIQALIAAAESHEVGALLAAPLTDTLKRVDEQQQVECTLDRSSLYRALTPQAFRVRLLLDAVTSANSKNLAITDEAAALEQAAHSPLVCVGAHSNIKVTYAEDLLFAEAYLAARSSRETT